MKLFLILAIFVFSIFSIAAPTKNGDINSTDSTNSGYLPSETSSRSSIPAQVSVSVSIAASASLTVSALAPVPAATRKSFGSLSKLQIDVIFLITGIFHDVIVVDEFLKIKLGILGWLDIPSAMAFFWALIKNPAMKESYYALQHHISFNIFNCVDPSLSEPLDPRNSPFNPEKPLDWTINRLFNIQNPRNSFFNPKLSREIQPYLYPSPKNFSGEFFANILNIASFLKRQESATVAHHLQNLENWRSLNDFYGMSYPQRGLLIKCMTDSQNFEDAEISNFFDFIENVDQNCFSRNQKIIEKMLDIIQNPDYKDYSERLINLAKNIKNLTKRYKDRNKKHRLLYIAAELHLKVANKIESVDDTLYDEQFVERIKNIFDLLPKGPKKDTLLNTLFKLYLKWANNPKTNDDYIEYFINQTSTITLNSKGPGIYDLKIIVDVY